MTPPIVIDWYTIEKLSATSSYNPDIDRLIHLEKNFGEFEQLEYEGIIQKLYQNQIDPIANALNYGQNDIIRHLRKLR